MWVTQRITSSEKKLSIPANTGHKAVIDYLLLAVQLRHQRPMHFPGYSSHPLLCLTPRASVPRQWEAFLVQSVDLLLEEIMWMINLNFRSPTTICNL